MSGLGSGEYGEFTFLDMIALMSFFIGVQNLDLNITQDDFQNMMRNIDERTELLLKEIHGHLEEQDLLLRQILEELKNDS